MLHLTDFTQRLLRDSAVTIGKFDGVHKGHRKLFETVLSVKEQGLAACGVSFFPETSAESRVIYSKEEQAAVAKAMGMDVLLQITLTEAVRSMEPEAFVKEILCDRLRAKLLVTGEDFRFGKDRAGDVALLRMLSGEYGYRLICVPKVEEGGARVSSTRIRKLLSEGAMEEANALLGQPYFVQGTVVHGKQLGRNLGLPTANVLPGKEKLLPSYGVYATRTKVEDKIYSGVTNVGLRPTVKDEKVVSVETFLMDFSGELYGKTVTTEFLHFIRPEKRFSSLEDLAEAMEKDKKEAFAKLKNM